MDWTEGWAPCEAADDDDDDDDDDDEEEMDEDDEGEDWTWEDVWGVWWLLKAACWPDSSLLDC